MISLRHHLQELQIGMSRKVLGLQRHSPNWEKAFFAADQVIKDKVPTGLELHHIGSTAIPGIHAKPILDILGVVPSIETFEQSRTALEDLGFVWKGEYGIAGRRYCVLYDEREEVGLIHLHVFASSDSEVEKHLVFRDYLSATPAAAQRYEGLKLKLAEQDKASRTDYSEGKSDLIAELIKEASDWRARS